MLVNRIIGTFTFRKGVYAEVEKDTSFTTIAWVLVIVIAFLNQLGSIGSALDWVLGAIAGTILTVLGFVVGVLVINWIGRLIFKADVSFDELVRTMGLAYVWRVFGILAILAAISDTLACVVGPLQIVTMILLVIAWVIAAKEALDLDWIQTIIAVILGWLAQFVIATFLTAFALGLFELTGGALGRLFGP